MVATGAQQNRFAPPPAYGVPQASRVREVRESARPLFLSCCFFDEAKLDPSFSCSPIK